MKKHEYATIHITNNETGTTKNIRTRCKVENKTQLILGTSTITKIIRQTRKVSNYDIQVSNISTIKEQLKYFKHGDLVQAEFLPEMYRLCLLTY
jgi:hypothetical protein